VQIIGHRGACGYEPENTLASFKKALKLGVDMVELDVYVLASGELVVMHDDKIDRTTNGTGYIESFTYAELIELNAGKGERIPLLREVLDIVQRKIPVNIELKGKGTAQAVAGLVREYVMELGWTTNDFYVSSFELDELRQFIQLMPDVRTSALYEGEAPDFIAFAQEYGTYSANFDAESIGPEMVKQAHAEGVRVFAYTVNDRSEARRLYKLRVDGIFSDYPDTVLPRRVQLLRALR
jgi:glycerophosphoryl diester phosphodiesterase